MTTDPLIGQTLDRYTFIDLIGAGAMGRVYLARHALLAREYAIKVLSQDLASSAIFVERFRREAIAMSQIKHPNVVPVIDFVTIPRVTIFLVMERITGRTLARVLEAEAPLTFARAGELTRQMALGLSAVHRQGFVHRDVKPANIMLSKTEVRAETAMLLDFGMVGYTSPHTRVRLTEEGSTLGTATYMAPEQALDPNVGPAADLYSLGVILYEMLAGRSPFAEDGTKSKAWTKPPMLPPAGGLEAVIDHLLEPAPELRIPSAEALVWELDRILPRLDAARLEWPDRPRRASSQIVGAPTTPMRPRIT
jgi:serine/threonine protein kinase